MNKRKELKILYAATPIKIVLICFFIACGKLVEVAPPHDTITVDKVFSSQKNTEGALLAIYSTLIHGSSTGITHAPSIFSSIATGSVTAAGMFASDEGGSEDANELISTRYSWGRSIWNSSYKVIQLCNAVIEGIERYAGDAYPLSIQNEYIAEAKMIRAFCYTILTNFFGDLPLVTTDDIDRTRTLSRSPKHEIVSQIVQDLNFAYEHLSDSYEAGNNERIRATRWAVRALLARVHLYQGNYIDAEKYASEIINSSLFELESLERVFLFNSREAIFQLKQSEQNTELRGATPEGFHFLPYPIDIGFIGNSRLSEEFLEGFENNDLRLHHWTDSTTQTYNGRVGLPTVRYPSKYKQGRHNSSLSGERTEYYMVFRLAEIYLIRAESRLNGAAGGKSGAIDDLNQLRARAQLPLLSYSLTDTNVEEAIMDERKSELFAEWGHRWMDLVRTGKAREVLSKTWKYQIWPGDWILLFPLPKEELEANPKLTQNPGYETYN